MPIKPENHYTLLLKTFRGKGITIIHRQLKWADGLYDSETNVITISSEHKNTLYGCYIICHEIAHYNQMKYNEHPEFFKLGNDIEFTEELFEYIMDVEMEAVKKANTMLKMFGIPYSPSELTKEGYQEARESWKNYYFRKRKK
jgi:hypothetical protein